MQRISPGVCVLSDLSGLLVLDAGIRIAEDFNLGRVVVGDQRSDEPPYRMPSEIGRYIPDAQTPLGRAVVVMRLDFACQPLFKAIGPFAAFVQDLLDFTARQIVV